MLNVVGIAAGVMPNCAKLTLRASLEYHTQRHSSTKRKHMTGHALEIHDLHTAYGPLHVLRGITLDVAQGEVFGLLGPNGAGKTTLVHTMLGLLKPQRGMVRVLGNNASTQAISNIGYLPERQRYHPHFTGREYLTTLGKLSGMRGQALKDRVATVLEGMDLLDAANRRLGTYSKGMLQRIGLAQAVLHDPDLLIIDEPTSGLDPIAAGAFDTLIRTLHKTLNLTVFMVTHDLESVATICDRVAVLAQGQIAALGTMADILASPHPAVHAYFGGERARLVRREPAPLT